MREVDPRGGLILNLLDQRIALLAVNAGSPRDFIL